MPIPTDLNQIPDWIAAQLVRAGVDRKSAMKWPVLVTGSDASGSSGRVVVLRRFEPQHHRAVIYTDRRSRKVIDLAERSQAELVFFDPNLMLQVRLRGDAIVHADGAIKDATFDTLSARSQSDYSTITAPGARLEKPQPERELNLSRDHFALIEIEAFEYDILSLERDGHRRAVIEFSDQKCHVSWVTP